MTTYAINTKDSEYRTTNSAEAARVAVAKLRNGQDPSAYAIVDMGVGVSVRKAAVENSVAATRKALVTAAK